MSQKFNPLSGQFDTVLDKASEISYDDSGAAITADNVQDAVDALDAVITALPDPIYYAGTWNATTNTPTLDNADVGAEGRLYRVTVAGTVDFGAGNISFDIGDSVVNNGAIWEKWDHSDQVLSVNSQTGAVVLDSDDISEGITNIYFTDERAQDAAGALATSSSKVSLTYNDGSGTLTPDIVANSLLNADINSAAAIAHSKMAALTASRAMVTDGSGVASVSATTSAEIGHVSGVTSAIQTQLDGKVDESVLSAKGSLISATAASTPVNVAVGTNGLFLKADSAQASGLVWAPASALVLSVSAKTANYTAVPTDDVILCSGTSFTVTLYAASGNSGRTITVKKTDISTSNVFTIDGNGSETIDGALTTTVDTQYEEVTLVCDGSNWHVLSRTIPGKWVAYTPTITGAGTPTGVNFRSRRVGGSLEVEGYFIAGTVTANPATITLGVDGVNSAASTLNSITANQNFGTWNSNVFGQAAASPIVAAGGTTTVGFGIANAAIGNAITIQNGNAIWANTNALSVKFSVPIQGWNS